MIVCNTHDNGIVSDERHFKRPFSSYKLHCFSYSLNPRRSQHLWQLYFILFTCYLTHYLNSQKLWKGPTEIRILILEHSWNYWTLDVSDFSIWTWDNSMFINIKVKSVTFVPFAFPNSLRLYNTGANCNYSAYNSRTNYNYFTSWTNCNHPSPNNDWKFSHDRYTIRFFFITTNCSMLRCTCIFKLVCASFCFWVKSLSSTNVNF